MEAIADDWDNVKSELGDDAVLTLKNGRRRVGAALSARHLDQSEQRALAFAWLGETINTFVNVLRPRVRSAVADYQARS